MVTKGERAGEQIRSLELTYTYTVCVSVVSNSLWPRSSPGSSDHGIFQARTLEWVAISFSRGSSWPRVQTWVSCISCIGRWILYHCAPGKPYIHTCCCSVIRSCLVSDSLWPHGLQHARPPCPPPAPGACPSSCSLRRWCRQLSQPLTSSSPSALNLPQHQGLFRWGVCLQQMTKLLELPLQHQ